MHNREFCTMALKNWSSKPPLTYLHLNSSQIDLRHALSAPTLCFAGAAAPHRLRLPRCRGARIAHQAVGSRLHLLGRDCHVPCQMPVVQRWTPLPSGARELNERLMEVRLRLIAESVSSLCRPPSRPKHNMEAVGVDDPRPTAFEDVSQQAERSQH